MRPSMSRTTMPKVLPCIVKYCPAGIVTHVRDEGIVKHVTQVLATSSMPTSTTSPRFCPSPSTI
eukprot:scaffold3441_cov64-Phaeocystis_antarctica.AAC.3